MSATCFCIDGFANARLRTMMSSSRGGVTERSLSRVRLYDPVRVAQPVVFSFFNARFSLCMRTPVDARAFIHRRQTVCLWAASNGLHTHNR